MLALVAAVAFLTRVPVTAPVQPADVKRAGVFFPLVGALIGAIQALAAALGASLLPPLPLSACVIAIGTAISGALHLDGLADTADGIGGGRSREDALRIMRDPAIGVFGTVAVVLVLLLKVSATSALVERGTSLAALVTAAALGRWTMVVLGHALPYARPEGGLGLSAGRFDRGQALAATAIFGVIAVAIGGGAVWPALLAGVAGASLVGAVASRRLGGFTGDVLGAANETAETAVLLAWLFLPT